MSRTHELILVGATGFTGRLVADELAAEAPSDLRWALAGRREGALKAVREALAARHPDKPWLAELPLVVADSHDEAAMDRLAASTAAVLTTVGPYLAHGFPLVAACARHGTHYADLTGETPFVRRSIDSLHAVAGASGARVVHCSGYDSVPSDVGTLVLQDAMARDGGPARRVTTYVGPSRGGVSGGTAASALGIVEAAAADREIARVVRRPYGLDPADDRGAAPAPDPTGPAWRAEIGQWTAPFFMGMVNTRVVRRSHALLGRPWGPDFVYEELHAMGPGWQGRVRASAVTAALGAFFGAASVPAVRGLMARHLLPKPGEGPSEEARETGFFRHLVLGVGADPTWRRLARVKGPKDPGYGATAIMLAEAGLALARPAGLPDAAGVLTPATGLGLPYADRLRARGFVFEAAAWPEEGVVRP